MRTHKSQLGFILFCLMIGFWVSFKKDPDVIEELRGVLLGTYFATWIFLIGAWRWGKNV